MANELNHIFDTSSAKFREAAEKLYAAPFDAVKARYDALIAEHCKEADGEVMMFSSPGRIEVIGNHTDHNNGKVLAAAVSVDLLAAVTPMEGKIIINSLGYPLVAVDLDDDQVNSAEYGRSEALVKGVIRGFRDHGYNVGGFIATTVSDVFKGAGMSSSASFEVMVTEVLNVLYNEGKIGPVERAIISQYAENVYFGKPSGLMDQSAIALGGIDYIDFKDTKNPVVEKLDWNFDDVTVAVINCGGDHCDLTPNYAAIRTEMEEIAKYFGKETLRFVDEADFYAKMPQLKEKFSGRAILRAFHFFEENRRVDGIRESIREGVKDKTMSYITASGQSSYRQLQNCYPEGDPAEPIPLALALIARRRGVLAYRVHGGGFAGTVLTMVDKAEKDSFYQYMATLYGAENVHLLKIRVAGACKVED